MLRFRAVNSRVWGALPVAYAGVLAATAACSGAAGMEGELTLEERAALEDRGLLEHRAVPLAHVDIEHSRNVGFESAQASAHFVYSHAATIGGRAPFSAVVSGMRSSTPEPGRCQDLTVGTRLPNASPVMLLEAGTVVIHTQPTEARGSAESADEAGEALVPDAHDPSADTAADTPDTTAAGDGANVLAAAGVVGDGFESASNAPSTPSPITISLAPRAFPGVSALASGVVYTNRDRDVPLPALAQYQVDIEGSDHVPAMSLRGVAPAYLRHVTVGGTPLDQVSFLAVGSPIDVTWDIGDAADLVVVDVANPSDRRAVLRCSYSDAAGAGTVPWVPPLADLATDSPRAELRIHRVRLVEGADVTSTARAARGQLRFDFELTRDVEFR